MICRMHLNRLGHCTAHPIEAKSPKTRSPQPLHYHLLKSINAHYHCCNQGHPYQPRMPIQDRHSTRQVHLHHQEGKTPSNSHPSVRYSFVHIVCTTFPGYSTAVTEKQVGIGPCEELRYPS